MSMAEKPAYKQRKRKILSLLCIVQVLVYIFLWKKRALQFSQNPAAYTHSISVQQQSYSETSSHIIKDTCTGKIHSCTLDNEKYSYIYFLAEPYALVVSEDKAIPELRGLNYFDYTFASVSRLAELTTLPILILVTDAVLDRDLMFLQGISKQILIKKVVPAYANIYIRTTKYRHVHTFGKYEVLSPKNVMGFTRLVFMVFLVF